MKKKLIAIVASLAMVATMVPASAFAGTAGTKAVSGVEVEDLSGISIKLPTASQMDDFGAWKTSYAEKTQTLELNSGIDGKFDNTSGKLTLTGTVPYTEGFTGDNTPNYTGDLANGNFIATAIRVINPKVDGVTGYAIVWSSLESSNGTQYTDYKLQAADFTDDTLLLMNRLTGSNQTYTVYYTTSDLSSHNGRYGDKAGLTGTKAELDALLDTNPADRASYIAGSRKVTLDTTGLKLLTKAQTTTYKANKTAAEGFVTAVKNIQTPNTSITTDKTDSVTEGYKTATTTARNTYATLTDEQKAIVDAEAKDAYDALVVAEANVASFDKIPEIATLIAALPSLEKLDVTDEAMVKQVRDAEAAVEALTDGVKKDLKEKTNADIKRYLADGQVDKYLADVKAVNNASAKIVIDAINALPTLPKAFENKDSVDAINAPLVAAEKAFDSLTKDEQNAVSNAALLTDYRVDYEKLLKAYVDPIYEAAAKINLEEPLTEENIALITELKAYVGDKYLDSKNIKDFKQTTYDALVAALDKVEKDAKSLANAEVTVAGADSIVYDGTKKTPEITVTIGGKEVAAEAYDKIYSDNKDAGEATITIIPNDESGYTGKKEVAFTIKPAALTADMVKVANATYTGKALKPAVSVASGVDYTVAYKNNTAVGKASAVVTGTGNYTGTITKNFIVKPAKESITSLKAGTKQITVAYKAQTGAKYRVICKASGLKAIGTNTTATKKTVKKLKSGKTYQVKVRAYKAVDGKTYYGTYSAVKKVKVK